MKNKRKGFTLIELLAVIVILGLLMAIAIPSITKYITESRKKTLVSTIGNYMSALSNEVNDLTYTFTKENTIYAVPIECIALERGGTNPFGEWHQASNSYWAYVLVQYDDINSKYTYGFTFKDSAGYGLYPTSQAKLNEQGKQIKTGYDDLKKLETRHALDYIQQDKYNGFNVNSSTRIIALVSESEGVLGNGESTCTLQQKGSNYDVVEQEKKDKWKIGREICFEEECFNIISSNSDTVTMLAKEKIDLTTSNPKQNANAENIKFFSSHYWSENPNLNEKYGNLKSKYGNDFPAFVYDENSNTYPYIEAYELYLKSLGIESVVASMISNTQIKNVNKDNSSHTNSWLKKDYVWFTGTLHTNWHIWVYREALVYQNNAFACGIRPVITVDKVDINFD